MTYSFEPFINKQNIDLSTKLVGVIIQDVIETEMLNKEKDLKKFKREIINKINNYLKLPVVSLDLKESEHDIEGSLEFRNSKAINFNLQFKQ